MNRIKDLRISLNLTQSELAKKIGLNQTAIGKYERSQLEPNLDTLKKMSDVFECSIDYILGFSDDLGVIQVKSQTEELSKLSRSEQQIIEKVRKKAPYEFLNLVSMYSELPRPLQENLFAELKGMHLAYLATKNKKGENN